MKKGLLKNLERKWILNVNNMYHKLTHVENVVMISMKSK